jgi:predicted ArsR family transcriptional regulator
MTTRETILNALKLKGPLRADDLASPLGLTAMAVRQHLYQLQNDGAVDCISVAQGRGRPAKKWQLTEKANIYFQDAHRDLTLDLISSVRELMGDEALDKLIEHRSDKQLAQYQQATEPANTLEGKLNYLAKARSQEGYMADISTAEDGTLLFVESHCPICEAAKACQGLCAKELDIFQTLFQGLAKVERTEHVLNGGRRCSYRVTKTD